MANTVIAPVCFETVPNRDARRKAAVQCAPEGAPLHSFRTLLADGATIAQHRVQPGWAKPSPATCACSAPSTACPQTDAGSNETRTYVST